MEAGVSKQPLSQNSDEQLLNGLREGRESAFRQLVDQQQDRVINICYGLLQHREDAEDVAQEVFLEVVRSVDRFRGDASLATWLYRIAVTRSLNHLQGRKRKQWLSSFTSLFGHRETPPDAPDQASDAQEQLEQGERKQQLMAAINSLPDNQKVAFTLSKFEELPYQEIARVMDTSLSAVESLIHRARKNLKKRLEPIAEKKIRANRKF